MNTERDPETGRFLRNQTDPTHPFAEYLPPPAQRDGRSDHRQTYRPQIVFRCPSIVYDKARALAERRKISLTQLMLEALFPLLEPEMHRAMQGKILEHSQTPQTGQKPGAPGVHFGQPHKGDRLAERIKSPVADSIPAHDHMGQWERREKEKRSGFVGGLVDRPRR